MLVEELLRECERMLEVEAVLACIEGRLDAVSITMWSKASGAEPGVAKSDLPGGLTERRLALCGR
jgi:hypothetical protein